MVLPVHQENSSVKIPMSVLRRVFAFAPGLWAEGDPLSSAPPWVGATRSILRSGKAAGDKRVCFRGAQIHRWELGDNGPSISPSTLRRSPRRESPVAAEPATEHMDLTKAGPVTPHRPSNLSNQQGSSGPAWALSTVFPHIIQ